MPNSLSINGDGLFLMPARLTNKCFIIINVVFKMPVFRDFVATRKRFTRAEVKDVRT